MAFTAPPSPAASVMLYASDAAGAFRYDNSDSVSPLEKRKALEDTAQWCLDRCIKLGHCEVFEDLNKMTTVREPRPRAARTGAVRPSQAQVQDFCKACVLTGEATQDEWAPVPRPSPNTVHPGRAQV